MKVAIAQINPTVGDLKANSQKILSFCHDAAHKKADIIIFPELSLLGYPPKDLLLRDDFLQAQEHFIEQIRNNVTIPAVIGIALKDDQAKLPFNAAIFCSQEKVEVVARKILLPNYNVFDEKRYFRSPRDISCNILNFKGKKILFSICEDAWNSYAPLKMPYYDFDPMQNAVSNANGVDVIVNMSASPFSRSKPATRELIFKNLAMRHKALMIIAGQVGANDQLLFDGHSMVIDDEGKIIKRAAVCEEDLLFIDTAIKEQNQSLKREFSDDQLTEILAMGIRDYVEKCNAPGVIIGLSGGIDSAVCLCLATKALGPKRVKAVFLPSRFSSERSLNNARALAQNLEIDLKSYPIEDAAQTLRRLLKSPLVSCAENMADIADQNLQSRLRGLMIMTLSNTNNHLMLATANKSELAVGYTTIYGDMCGALSPIGDLYKTEVYKLANALNNKENIIPKDIIMRPPSAELKADQLDTDSLPDYSLLDQILYPFIDLEWSAQKIHEASKISLELIEQVIEMVAKSEYKRRQAPFPLMVSNKVFGDARRLPIAKKVSGIRQYHS